MNRFVKSSLLLVACLCLSACFHTQLNGSVGGAEVTVAPLDNPDNVLATGSSMRASDWIGQGGQQQWDDWSSLLRLLVVGVTQFGAQLSELDSQSLYVVTAHGGEDYDPGRKQLLSDSPVEVQGSWHVIATGERITEGNLKISVLTEALYRQQLQAPAGLSNKAILDRLNAAAQLVVGDVDRNGTIDYDDVLRWNQTIDGAFLLGPQDKLAALSDAVTSGQPADMLDLHSREVLGSQRVEMSFDVGTVLLETYNWESPVTAANFLNYVRAGFYDQMLVHRAINGFMIQMGLLSFDGYNDEDRVTWSIRTPGPSIINEASNRLSNSRGTLSMARTSDPNSATAQFFINQADNSFLDFGSSNNPDGYAVFARVYSGMSVVDEIAAEPTTQLAGVGSDVPARGVLLQSVRFL
jgi:cyclophilin family peptidyl-prolyl cis-trans isomerase